MKKVIFYMFTIILVLTYLLVFAACNETDAYKTNEEQVNDSTLTRKGNSIARYTVNEEQFNDLILNGSTVLSPDSNVTIKVTQGIPEENYIEERIIKISGNLYSETSKNNVSYREIEKNTYDEISETFAGFYYYKNNEEKWIKQQSTLSKESFLTNCGYCFETWNFGDFDFDKQNKIYINNKTLYREGYQIEVDGGILTRKAVVFKEIRISFSNGKINNIYYKADVGTYIQNAVFTLEFYDYETTSVILPTME